MGGGTCPSPRLEMKGKKEKSFFSLPSFFIYKICNYFLLYIYKFANVTEVIH